VKGLAEHRWYFAGVRRLSILPAAKPLFDQVDLSALKILPLRRAPCPEDLHREWLRRTAARCWSWESEGLHFASIVTTASASCCRFGNPVPETEVEVVDLETGTRVLPMVRQARRVRGPRMMIGYHNKPEERRMHCATATCYTVISVMWTRMGSCFLSDRKKDMVMSRVQRLSARDRRGAFNHPPFTRRHG